MAPEAKNNPKQADAKPASGFVFTAADYPRSPGVYLMKDSKGVVLYVGKANVLRTRLRSYFRKDADGRYQIKPLLKRLAAIETIVTATEKEALLLEHNLIRKHRPRYNIWFRDDKSYSSIKVTKHEFPALFRTRQIRKDGAEYFGPYTSGTAARDTSLLVTKFFRLRTCRDREFANRSRPCLQYQIGQCTAPCVGYVSAEEYARQVEQARLLLRGRRNELSESLEARMQEASLREAYEEAAQYRDVLQGIAGMAEAQRVVKHGASSCDYVACVEAQGRAAVSVLHVVDGKVEGKAGAVVDASVAHPSEISESFVLQYYQSPRVPAAQIMCSAGLEWTTLCHGELQQRRDGKVRVHHPQRGVHAHKIKLALENAQALLERQLQRDSSWESIAAVLQRKLGIGDELHTIECVDISNWQGKEAVGSLVAFTEGKSAKERYRHFVIRGKHEPNDYAMMHEVLSRRLQSESAPPRPDVLMVDGGKGQLAMAERALAELGIEDQCIASIAKPREDESSDKIYIPGRKNPIALKAGDPALLLLQAIRDEAHRFAITHQRKRQRKKSLEV